MSLTRKTIPQFILGLTIIGIGISSILIAKAGYGPWDIFFYHLVELFDTSFLVSQTVISSILLGISALVARERPNIKYLISLVSISYVSIWIDWLIQLPSPSVIWLKYLVLVFGLFLVAIGINISRIANVVLLPIEFMNNAFYHRSRFSFGRIKQFVEAVVLILSILIAFVFALDYKIGFGTLFIAVMGGQFVNWTYPWVHKLIH